MADIANELSAISSAKYGEEVRGSIKDAIRKINDVVETSEVSDLTSISTAFLDKIYKNERILGYNPGTDGYGSLTWESNTKFVSVIVPIRFAPSGKEHSYIRIPFSSDDVHQSQIVFFNNKRNAIFNKMFDIAEGFVTVDFNDIYDKGNTNLINANYIAFSTTGPLYDVEYHNVLSPDALTYESVRTDQFVKNVKFNAFVIGRNTGTSVPNYSQDPYFKNYVTLTVKVNPNRDSRIIFPYHYDGQVSGILENGTAQVLMLDSDGQAYLNKEFNRSDNKVTITFSTEDELRASYVMFSTDGNPSDVEYHNVLSPDALTYESVRTDQFVKNVKFNAFVIGRNTGTSVPNYSQDPYFKNYVTLTVKVNPNRDSRIIFPYHYDGQVSGILENGTAQVLMLDSDGQAYLNKEFNRSDNKVTITFSTEDELRASYVMFSTDGNPSDVEYHNVLSPDALTIQSIDRAIVSSLYTNFGIFRNMACLGDSYTAGGMANSGGSWVGDGKNNSWPNVIGARDFLTVKNFAVGGHMVKDSYESVLSKVLSDMAYDGYTYCWGINDSGDTPELNGRWEGLSPAQRLGTSSDIVSGLEEPKHTFYGYYSSIIRKIQNHAPNACHLIIVSPPDVEQSYRQAYKNATIEIANQMGIPYINPIDDPFFTSNTYRAMNLGHPTRQGYLGMAIAFERLFSKCVENHSDYFKNAVIG